jgi:hypothetical protein
MSRLPIRCIVEEISPKEYEILWNDYMAGRLVQESTGMCVVTVTGKIGDKVVRIDAVSTAMSASPTPSKRWADHRSGEYRGIQAKKVSSG